MLKTQKEVSFIGTRYYPVDIDPCLSPYTTVLATIWDEDHMVGQVNQTEILAWWSEEYKEPARETAGQDAPVTGSVPAGIASTKSDGVLLPKNT